MDKSKPSAKLRKRLEGSPEPHLPHGYTMFRNDKLLGLIEEVEAVEHDARDATISIHVAAFLLAVASVALLVGLIVFGGI